MSISKYGTKSFFRNIYKKKRNNISQLQKIQFSERICKNIQKILDKNICNEKYIALFAGTQEEPSILSLIEKFPRKKFCFPRIDADGKAMNFYHISKISDLKVGKFGIREPKKNCQFVDKEEIKIFCIPAVSIDIKGNRIGMGGGFYDKYLSKLSKLSKAKNNYLKIGIIFSCQVSKTSFENFSEEFDIPMDITITEKNILYFPIFLI